MELEKLQLLGSACEPSLLFATADQAGATIAGGRIAI